VPLILGRLMACDAAVRRPMMNWLGTHTLNVVRNTPLKPDHPVCSFGMPRR